MKKQRNIMVVDDEPAILKLLSRVLGQEGYGVIVTDNGRTALNLLEKHLPDLIILDIMMPELDGFQVLSRLRQRSNIPVIMLNAKCEVGTEGNALRLGADDYVEKPFHTRELLARIRAKLRRAP